MKNYLRHNFRGQYRSGRSRISLLNDKHQATLCSSNLVFPLKGIISEYIPEKHCRHSSAIDKVDEKEKKNFHWLDDLIWNNKSSMTFAGDVLKRECKPFRDSCHAIRFGLLKNFSNFDKSYINFTKDNYKHVNDLVLHDLNNDTLKQIQSAKDLKSQTPNVTKFIHPVPYLEFKRIRNHNNPYFRKLIKSSYEISNYGNRNFTTLRAKTESSKPNIQGPSNISRSLSRSVENVLSDSGHSAQKANERDLSGSTNEKWKRRDFDWLNSFSSEAVILQPSKGEFSIKKLINRTNSQERLWGLPRSQSLSKTFGPGMNDNLIQYMALKNKMQSEFKAKNYGDGNGQDQEIKKLIKSAEEKNRQGELKKKENNSAPLSAKKMFRTIKDSIGLKPIDMLQRKENTARNNEEKIFQKAPRKRGILNFRLPNFKKNDNQKNSLQNDKPINNTSETEYESSASYKHVFQELFNNANKTKVPSKSAVALSFFNRQQASRHYFRPVSKFPSDKSVRNEKEIHKQESSGAVVEGSRIVNLKNQARTPFQKPSNSQLISKSKANYSTVSKIPSIHSSYHPNLFKKGTDTPSWSEIKSSQRSLSTEWKEKKENKPVIKKTLYSTLGYYPVLHKTIAIETKKKIKSKKSKSVIPKKKDITGKNLNQTQPNNLNSRCLNQRRSLSSFGALVGNVTETGTSAETVTGSDEHVFKEVMNLCKGQSKTEKKTGAKKTKLKRYNRCSVQEKKKPEKRRGFVCRLANMLNIGCGRRRRSNTGCQECGKKASKQTLCLSS